MVQHRTNALATCAHCFLGSLPLNKAAEIPRQLVESLEAKPVETDAPSTKEGKHANDVRALPDSKCTTAAQFGAGDELAGTHLAVPAHVAGPVGRPCFPYDPEQPLASGHLNLASQGREALEFR